VFLAPLADKFVRLALQLVARYAGWLAAGLAARSGQPTESADEVNAVPWGEQFLSVFAVTATSLCCRRAACSCRANY